jgi:hypothetical protein
MKECPKCKFENQEDSAECPRCGLIYAKYRGPLADQESPEESAQSEDVEIQEEVQRGADEGARPKKFKEKPHVVLLDFLKKNYIGTAAVLFLLLVGIVWLIYSAITEVEGKTGIVSWKKVIGEDGESALLFDTIDLLKSPILPDEETSLASDDAQNQGTSIVDPTILCRIPSRTPVKVLKNEGEFLRIKVLKGECSGKIGYIQPGHFEKK